VDGDGFAAEREIASRYGGAMDLRKRARQAGSIGGLLIHDPSQTEYLAKWWRSIRGSTVDLELPWMPYRVIEMLEEHVRPDHRVFEYGGGGSTLWFSRRCGELVTVEHDREWFPILERIVGDLPNVTLSHQTDDNDWAGYVGAINAYPDDHFDIIVVDGRQRVRCFEQARFKVKPGGLLILDNSDRDRYAETHGLVARWPFRKYRGITPTEPVATQTTVWRRPGLVGWQGRYPGMSRLFTG
jgi:predicted O-methyltransferase YrrM